MHFSQSTQLALLHYYACKITVDTLDPKMALGSSLAWLAKVSEQPDSFNNP
jgi:hypothetical protein